MIFIQFEEFEVVKLGFKSLSRFLSNVQNSMLFYMNEIQYVSFSQGIILYKRVFLTFFS